MANIKLIRADFRLIHGQVVTKWTKEAHADKIVVINDTLAADKFLASVYIMAAPSGIVVEVFSVKSACEKWKENQLGEGNLLILFKTAEDANRALKDGFPINHLQIGGLGGGGGRINVMGAISFDNKDVQLLKEMQQLGTHVYLHILPTEPKVEFDKILKKHKFN